MSSVQQGLGGISNGMPSQNGAGNTPEPIHAMPHQNADFDVPGVKGYQQKNLTTYGRTTAWASGKGPTPISKQTIGSYLNFDA
jgi:hypothetical protein